MSIKIVEKKNLNIKINKDQYIWYLREIACRIVDDGGLRQQITFSLRWVAKDEHIFILAPIVFIILTDDVQDPIGGSRGDLNWNGVELARMLNM